VRLPTGHRPPGRHRSGRPVQLRADFSPTLVNSDENWLRWDSASGKWLAMPLADYGEYCENQ
jgi:hypothetical protein